MNTKMVHKLCQACNLYLHMIWCSCHCKGGLQLTPNTVYINQLKLYSKPISSLMT
uniref:Uncharacterized protein n=1 Tax=Arundo donax TaxID=35708 RepID=A0A0A8XX44_ARUDO